MLHKMADSKLPVWHYGYYLTKRGTLWLLHTEYIMDLDMKWIRSDLKYIDTLWFKWDHERLMDMTKKAFQACIQKRKSQDFRKGHLKRKNSYKYESVTDA